MMLNHCDVYQYMTTVHKMETVHRHPGIGSKLVYIFREFTSCLASQDLTARAFRKAVAAAASQVQENVKIGPCSRCLPYSSRLDRGLVEKTQFCYLDRAPSCIHMDLISRQSGQVRTNPHLEEGPGSAARSMFSFKALSH